MKIKINLNFSYKLFPNFKINDIKNRNGHDISKEQIDELEFLLKNYDIKSANEVAYAQKIY